MNSPPNPRPAVSVTCSKCGRATTVPFTPTPGRPVYCSDCFAKQSTPRAEPQIARPRMGDPSRARRPMLAQGRKAHFVYDVMEVLSRGGTMPEDQRRVFVEGLFARGARQGSEAAYEFLVQKHGEKILTDDEANRIQRLLEKYSFFR